jgi:serine/threonine-protein kinase
MTETVRHQPGDTIAGYLLEEQIGEGGMAVVFRARDERLGRLVALKLLAPGLAADDAFRQRFIRESRAAAAVDHPHIIPIYEAGEAGGVLFIAMRYVKGGDVRTLLDGGGPLPAARAWAIVTQVAVALDSAHRRGLIHRDVKPGNILLDAGAGQQAEHAYLSDFGISKQPAGASSLTLAGQFVGTLDYIAPEQIDGHDLDGRADLYALGCAAYELLSGRPPFRQAQGLALVGAHLSEPPPALSAERPDLPAAADRVLTRAMAKSPAARYPTCAQFAADLGRSLGLVPGTPAPAIPMRAGPLRAGPATGATRPAPPRPQPRPTWPQPAPAPVQRPRPAARRPVSGALTAGVIAAAAGLAAAAVFAVLAARGHGPGPAEVGAGSPVPAVVSGAAPTSAPAAGATPAGASPPAAIPTAPAIAPPPPSAGSPSAGSPSVGSPSAGAENAQAADMSSLLTSGAGTNPRLITALSSINRCANVAGSLSTLTQIRNQRSSEYEQAQAISVSLLPQGAAMKTDLAQALYYSLQADDQYLNWASQQSGGPCQDGSEPAVAGDNGQASSFKGSFTQLWNPIAQQYGLTPQSVTSM